jgi:hypothetical protein
MASHHHQHASSESAHSTPHPHGRANTPHTPHAAMPHTPTSPHTPHDALQAQHEAQHDADEIFCKKARAHAEQLWAQRKALMDEQDRLWNAGDHAGARAKVEKAKEVAKQADAAEDKAAEEIFAMKNARMQPEQMDLHGLRVDEAIRFLKRRIAADRSSSRAFSVVIYGAGHHSAGHQQKIKPAVLDVLRREKLSFQEDWDGLTNHANAGCVTVTYTPGAAGANAGASAASAQPHAGQAPALALRSAAGTPGQYAAQPTQVQGKAAAAKEDDGWGCLSCCSVM